jgi:GT2 family glycosyltransferase
MKTASSDITVTIVNTNNCDLLEICLRSLNETAAALTLEIIVVDNASQDGSVEMIRREFPNVVLLQNAERSGFSFSHNRALEQSTGRYCFVLNDDTKVLPNSLQTLMAFMDAHAEAGACGPKLLNRDGTLQRTANHFPTLLFGIFEALSINRLFPNNPVWRKHIYADWDRSTTRAVDAVSGAALLVRRGAMNDAGMLDPNFFLYSEEVDWCLRIHQHGWKIFYIADARVIHFGGASTATRMPEKFHRIFWNSFLYYYRKHFGIAAYWLVRILFEFRMLVHRFISFRPFKTFSGKRVA